MIIEGRRLRGRAVFVGPLLSCGRLCRVMIRVFAIDLDSLRISCPIRARLAFSALSCALLLICGPTASAKSQETSGAAKSAKTTTKSRPKPHKKTSSSTARKSGAGSTIRSRSHASTATRSASVKRRHGSTRVASKTKKLRGQQKIDSDRVQEIQQALIREHYLTGEATGTWNQSSEDAMRRYQADHGWQSKTVPDSRALIKLGLGPSHDHLLNPDSAMTTQPDAPQATPLDPVSHSADPGPVPAKAPADPTPAAPAPAATTDPSGSSSPQ